MKVILKKFEDKYICKGGGSFCVILIPINKFKDQVKLVMKCFKFNIFSKDKMEMHMEHNLSLSTPKEKHISNSREKESPNLAWSNLFEVKEDYCNIIVN